MHGMPVAQATGCKLCASFSLWVLSLVLRLVSEHTYRCPFGKRCKLSSSDMLCPI